MRTSIGGCYPRLQNADLLTEHNLYEAGLARKKIKPEDFFGK